eukprot:s1687_g10.t1
MCCSTRAVTDIVESNHLVCTFRPEQYVNACFAIATSLPQIGPAKPSCLHWHIHVAKSGSQASAKTLFRGVSLHLSPGSKFGRIRSSRTEPAFLGADAEAMTAEEVHEKNREIAKMQGEIKLTH